MLIYKLHERILQFSKDGYPKYPAEAEINIELKPKVQFGGVSGSSRAAVGNREMLARFNLSTGQTRIDHNEPIFGPVEANIEIAGTSFSISKDIATVKAHCKNQQDLTDLLATLFYAFPSILNIYLQDVPYPTHAWGKINNKGFRWVFESSGLQLSARKTSKEFQEELITKSWRQIAVITNSRRLIGGLQYFHVACRLLEAGSNRFEFMAEALLNLAKSLQSTFGESRDRVREELLKLSLFEKKEIEAKIMPVMILRNEFDVGHISLSLLTNKQLKTLHEYTRLTEYAFKTLYSGLLEKLEAGEYEMLPDTSSHLAEKKKIILRRIWNNIKPYI